MRRGEGRQGHFQQSNNFSVRQNNLKKTNLPPPPFPIAVRLLIPVLLCSVHGLVLTLE